MTNKSLFQEYDNYTDPIVGYDDEYEIHYSDVYGIPKHQISFAEWLEGIR